MSKEQQRGGPRVVIFPLAAQGHVNAMLKLAELLALFGIHVTFINTHSTHNRLLLNTDIEARFATYPGFLFKTISDGLPDDHPRTSGGRFMDVIYSMISRTKPLLKHMLVSGQLGSVTCIIADGIFGGFTADIGDELQIPVIHFRTISPSCFWAYFSISDAIQAGELPITGKEDMDRAIKSVLGMESFLRCRDLPSFCRVSDVNDSNLQFVARQTRQSSGAQALIFNTFEQLDGPAILSHIRTQCPKIYTIGPLHAHLKLRLANKETSFQSSNSSFFQVDKNCMLWLDAQPLNSVIYVSFGSLAILTRDQLMEFWYGLVNSKKRFLWVMRPDLVANKEDGDADQIPADLREGTEERGCIVEWAPQEEVLEHQAVGGFLTHSGWNSILESVIAGVPMICWPCLADQQLNSRMVSEVWKLGIDMKDVCDRKIVEKMVNELMVERREEFQRAAKEMSRLATESVNEGGSSYCNLDTLIQDIYKINMQ